MKKVVSVFSFCMLLLQSASAQQKNVQDSAALLPELTITAFGQNRVVNSGTVVQVIETGHAGRFNNKTSLVAAFNAKAGVRMEERSPGSYRINIRGSSLRSPFGVRNVKVYWNDIPMTDAGGNTYFNQFSLNDFAILEIIKGPAGSIYGAGTGGAILMRSPENSAAPVLQLDYALGSFGMQNLLAQINWGSQTSGHTLSYHRLRSDGYRQHTQQHKDKLSWTTSRKISDRDELTGCVLYNNLFYETPGALTLAEYNNNPRSSRPATGSFPSATEAKAAIYQKNLTIGFTNRYRTLWGLKNTTTVYSTFNHIKNPAIRNYERRIEPGFGGRTTFTYNRSKNGISLQLLSGAEWQYGFYNTLVSKNRNGNPDTLQTNDDIRYVTGIVFAQGNVNFKSWTVTAGISLNRSAVRFSRLSLYPVVEQRRTYPTEFSPRIALQKQFADQHEVFASVSRGFSPPTIAELLPSTGVISTGLEAEYGINYEAGWRMNLLERSLKIDLSFFYFGLNNALVSRRDSANADFFVNAGNTRQRGIEINADYLLSVNSRLIKQLGVRPALTLNKFTYGSFVKGTNNFSGKHLPGVAGAVLSCITDLYLPANFHFTASYLFNSDLFLNDSNTASAEPFHLFGCRLSSKINCAKRMEFEIYAGIDNLLDDMYSLGNDINAAAGRYYNAAPRRNYFAGISFQCNRKSSHRL